MQIKIALIDDQQLFRDLLAAMLRMGEELIVVRESESGLAFLTYLEQTTEYPDIAIVDMSMPVMNGLDLTKILQERYPEIKVIILSVNYSDQLISKAIDLGASGYLNKNCDIHTLKQAIQSVFFAGFYMDADTLRALRDRSGKIDLEHHDLLANLTKREVEVLVLICQELTTSEIADRLFLSTRTVEGHRNNLLLKTGCKNTAGLVVYAIKQRIFEVLN